MIDTNEENAISIIENSQDIVLANENDEDKLPLFSSIMANPIPIRPIPQDIVHDIKYQSWGEEKCNLCNTPIREEIEHWFISHKKRPTQVQNYIRDYYGARILYESIDTHMRKHCDFSRIGIDGLELLKTVGTEKKVQDIKYFELDYAFNGIMLGIDELLSIDTRNRPELLIEKQKMLRQYYRDLATVGKEREAMPINILQILAELLKKIDHLESKQIIFSTIREIRARLERDLK